MPSVCCRDQEANHRDSMDSSYSTSTTGETEDVDALSVWLKDRRMEGVTEGIPAPKTLEVLSVDDEAVNQYVMEDLMTHSGFKYTKAMDARECLNILSERFSDRGVSSFPDIILMDQRMPHMTGLEATKLIRSRYPTSKVPIIMLSANNDEASIVEGLEVGCNDYICKPFKRSELLARVALQLKVLELHKKEVEARQHVQILKEILPVSVIDRLKRGQTQIADELDNVTILVSDVVGFAGMARSATASKILEMLDKLFTTFDQLVDKHGVFKVETHGKDCGAAGRACI